MAKLIEIFIRFLVLGCYSFGGPTAHIGYFRKAFVEKYQWLTDQEYADTVALCQMLPGPASSQVGMSIGYHRAGFAGALTAFIGFTLPSALLMTILALVYTEVSGISAIDGLLHGIKLFAVAVVADALVKMGKSLCPDRRRITLAILAAVAMLLLPGVMTQVVIIAIAAALGYLHFKCSDSGVTPASPPSRTSSLPKVQIATAGLLFLVGLFVLPIIASTADNTELGLFDSFYRAGALVFGGGHVVLPMLQAEVVHAGGVTPDAFLVGYSAAQAVPGPMFTLATFLGGVYGGTFNISHAMAALAGIFAPSFLLLIAVYPLWSRLKQIPQLRGSIDSINAAVVGLLLAAFYNPVITLAIDSSLDVALALLAYLLLAVWNFPVAWLVALFGGLGYMLF